MSRLAACSIMALVVGCATARRASMAPERQATSGIASRARCQPVSYSVDPAMAPMAAGLVREAAAEWNAAVGRAVLVESSGAPEVSSVPGTCPAEPQAAGETKPDGRIVIYNAVIRGATVAEVTDRWRSVAAHEFGHRLIGPVHLDDPAALMAAGDNGAMAPTDSDVSAIGCPVTVQMMTRRLAFWRAR